MTTLGVRGSRRLLAIPVASLLTALLALGCAGTAGVPAADQEDRAATVVLEADDRPFVVQVPASYDAARRVPLVVGLHGWGSDGARVAGQLGLTAATERRGWLLALPEGTLDSEGRRYWNASSACCNVDGTRVDDVGHLSHVIDTVSERYAVDPARVYVVGVSNGGFMAHRLACERADLVSAVVAVAGTTATGPLGCAPSSGVSVLQVHGTSDDVIRYRGGALLPGRPYASARATVEAWRTRGRCASRARAGSPLDADASLPGAETTRTTWSGCDDGTSVGLWTVAGGAHSPRATEEFADAVLGWLTHHDARPRPPRR